MKPAPTQRLRARHLIRIAAALAVLVASAAVVGTSPASSQQGLADLAPPGLAVGAVLPSYDTKWNQGEYLVTADAEFNAITATAYLPWGPWPSRSTGIDTGPFEEVVDWARQPGREMLVHGHVLVYPWANQSSDWYQSASVDGQREALNKQYVEAFAGVDGVDVWDVVNEVMADSYQLDNNIDVDEWGLRTDYIEYQEIGADYVDKAFGWADAVVDDDVALIINDYGTETINSKSTKLLEYAIELRDRGVAIDGVGFQMHIGGTSGEPDYASIRKNFDRFANAGFDIYITELDVQATNTTSPSVKPTSAELDRQARIFGAITRIAAENSSVKTLLMWDFADNRSWLNPDRNGIYQHPTPWAGGAVGEPMTPKPAYFAMAQALGSGEPDPVGEVPVSQVRFANEWQTSDAYLTRVGNDLGGGTYGSSPGASLYELNSASESWSSMQWVFEPTGDGYYRIRNQWDPSSGYLTRDAESDGTPAAGIYLDSLNPDWWSQQWRVESIAGNSFSITNRWQPSDGVLTRDGIDVGGGTFEPSDTASLYAPATWSSQHWILD